MDFGFTKAKVTGQNGLKCVSEKQILNQKTVFKPKVCIICHSNLPLVNFGVKMSIVKLTEHVCFQNFLMKITFILIHLNCFRLHI